MKLGIHYIVRKGIHKKKCEDSALIGNMVINDAVGSAELELPVKICIADGVGGNAGGDEASLFLLHQIKSETEVHYVDEVKNSLVSVNKKLLKQAEMSEFHKQMAATFTGIFINKDNVILAHCGNTRLYVLQGSFLKQVTVDHTTYQWLMMNGKADAAELCNKSEIRGAFGGGSERYLAPLVVEEIFERGIPSVLLFTSDGVHDYLEIDELENIVSGSQTAEERIKKLVTRAVENGSEDDCTALLVEII